MTTQYTFDRSDGTLYGAAPRARYRQAHQKYIARYPTFIRCEPFTPLMTLFTKKRSHFWEPDPFERSEGDGSITTPSDCNTLAAREARRLAEVLPLASAQ